MATTSTSSAVISNIDIIDDTQPLTCQFQATETIDNHIVYVMKVHRGFDASKSSWLIKRRYNEFNELYNELKVSQYDLQLPPKKTFGNMKPEFLSTRQLALQQFIDQILSNLLLANTFCVKKFLDEDNYDLDIKGIALAHVSMFFRSEPAWQVIEPLNQIGWRFRKQLILLNNKNISTNTKYLLTWCQHGPDKYLKENELKTIFQQMALIQHDNIETIIDIHSGDTSTIMIQQYNEKTISLRDFIYDESKMNVNYIKKYCKPLKSGKSLDLSLIKLISKQILLVLQWLYAKGLYFGHLHSGNVLVDQKGNGSIKLTDLPNSLLGLSSMYRSFIVEQRRISNLELVDVYGFGHILYEMIYGESLVMSSSRTDFADCPNEQVKKILELILLEETLNKSGPPTINELLEMDFFKNVYLPPSLSSSQSPNSSSKNSLKLFNSSKQKDLIAKSREFIEKRLNEEQKNVIFKHLL
jgi:PX domain-containing protein kinase-like protein